MRMYFTPKVHNNKFTSKFREWNKTDQNSGEILNNEMAVVNRFGVLINKQVQQDNLGLTTW